MVNLYNICWYLLAQNQNARSKVAEAVGEAAGDAPAVPPQPKGFFDNMGLMFPILMGALMLYFLMMTKPKPQNQAKNDSELLANLKKNDRVVTAGGILGTVVNYRSSDSEYVTIRIDDSSNTRMQVLAKSIIRVVSDEKPSKD